MGARLGQGNERGNRCRSVRLRHVRQGQVIGFVGSTGLSTGAHVHYEILVNNRFVDPMRIKLPRGRVLEGLPLALFEKDRDQLDSLIARTPAHVAQAH